MILNMLAAVVGSKPKGFVLNLPGGSEIDFSATEPAVAGWRFKADGTVVSLSGPATNGRPDWISPLSAASQYTFYLRWTNPVITLGSVFNLDDPSGEDNWVALSSDRTYRSQDAIPVTPAGIQAFSVDFEISLDQSTVLASGTYSISVDYESA